MTQPLIEAAQALIGLLRAAEDGGLPLPTSADVSKFAPHGATERHAEGGIEFLVEPEQLADWSTWLDSPIADGDVFKGHVHRRVHGHAGPISVKVYALVPVESVAS